jgi:hypothetical protein
MKSGNARFDEDESEVVELESERECSSCSDLLSSILVSEIGRMCTISYDHELRSADEKPREIENMSESAKSPCTMSSSKMS